MDPRERKTTLEEVLRAAFESQQAGVWTALIGVVQSYNPAKQTCVVQPAVNGKALQIDGTWLAKQLPLLVDCPVVWQGGGGVTLTFPIAKGDECLVVFASRCIDTWYARGFSAGGTADVGGKPGTANAANNPPEYRMHNLSDGFVLAGVRSQPRSFATDTQNAVLRSDDGTTFISLNPTSKAIAVGTSGTLTVNASAGITMNSVTIDSSGNVVTQGNVTSKGKVLATHVHTDPQGGNTGVPV